MHIEWTPNKSNAGSPYFFRQAAEWQGVKIHRAHVAAGRMPVQTSALHEINFSLGGSFFTEKVSATGRFVRTKSGTGHMCLTPSGQTVAARWDKPLRNLGILISPEFARTTAVENGYSENFEFVEIYKATDALVPQIGLALLDEAASESPVGRLYADSLVQTLTLHLLRNYSNATARGENHGGGGLSGFRLRRVAEFIDANLGDEISLADLAATAELSQFHFARAFRKSTGETPQQYVMRRRVERAKQLLADRRLPLVEVALSTGFKSQSHFTSLFRKLTNLTPGAWRNSF